MPTAGLNIVILGLSITSSWGNGHATTYRGLMRALVERGHSVLFLERDVPWYATARDLPHPPYGTTALYHSIADLQERFTAAVRQADVVIVGSYVPEGTAVGAWVLQTATGISAFYDIDTPVTMATLRRGDCEYLSPALIPRYTLYLSFTGGPLLDWLERLYGAAMARPLYCAADPDLYAPAAETQRYDLGYMGTYSADRQAALHELLLVPAQAWPSGRFIVVGPQYPEALAWPANVERLDHLPPSAHRRFYNAQRFTLNITRADMRQTGFAPGVRLFEAAACGIPIISDDWPGLDTFFTPGTEILLSRSATETLHYLRDLSQEACQAIGAQGRARLLAEHTAAHRAATLEDYVREACTASR
ncbi:MAG: glycosyltransferase [Candidatus Tectimicrobiota bacterium]